MSGRGEAVYGLLRHVRPIVLNSARVVEAQLRGTGWTVGSRAVVEALLARGPAPVPQVARWLDLPRQGVQRHVDDLRSLGHLEARANPRHRRSRLVAVTEAGREAYERVHAAELAQLRTLATDCSDAEIATATRVLASLDRDIRDRARAARGQEGP